MLRSSIDPPACQPAQDRLTTSIGGGERQFSIVLLEPKVVRTHRTTVFQIEHKGVEDIPPETSLLVEQFARYGSGGRQIIHFEPATVQSIRFMASLGSATSTPFSSLKRTNRTGG